MVDVPPEPVSDDEAETVLSAVLRSSRSQLPRPAECFMATATARHLVYRLALAGLSVVGFPQRRLT